MGKPGFQYSGSQEDGLLKVFYIQYLNFNLIPHFSLWHTIPALYSASDPIWFNFSSVEQWKKDGFPVS
jgi:hypothetical protein